MLNTLHIIPTWVPERGNLQTWARRATYEPRPSKVPVELAASATAWAKLNCSRMNLQGECVDTNEINTNEIFVRVVTIWRGRLTGIWFDDSIGLTCSYNSGY